MPVGPELADKLDEVDIGGVFSEIDSRISDENWLRDWKTTSPTGNRWEIVIRRELTTHQKNKVINAYKSVGWDLVLCRNSSENKERPGLCCISFERQSIAVDIPPKKLLTVAELGKITSKYSGMQATTNLIHAIVMDVENFMGEKK